MPTGTGAGQRAGGSLPTEAWVVRRNTPQVRQENFKVRFPFSGSRPFWLVWHALAAFVLVVTIFATIQPLIPRSRLYTVVENICVAIMCLQTQACFTIIWKPAARRRENCRLMTVVRSSLGELVVKRIQLNTTNDAVDVVANPELANRGRL